MPRDRPGVVSLLERAEGFLEEGLPVTGGRAEVDEAFYLSILTLPLDAQ